MVDAQNNNSTEKKFGTLAIIIIVLLALIAVAFLAMPYLWKDESNNSNKENYAQTYTNITVDEAFELLNQSNMGEINLTIIDCRGIEGCSSCQYRKGHLPGAVQNDNPLSLENETDDILVYSKDGTIGAGYCENLTLNQVYGNIYNLLGGWNAWKRNNNLYGWPPIIKG